jgi:hypothetical protein
MRDMAHHLLFTIASMEWYIKEKSEKKSFVLLIKRSKHGFKRFQKRLTIDIARSTHIQYYKQCKCIHFYTQCGMEQHAKKYSGRIQQPKDLSINAGNDVFAHHGKKTQD